MAALLACPEGRDRANAAAGLVTLRFTHYEVRYEPGKVAAELSEIVASMAARRTGLAA